MSSYSELIKNLEKIRAYMRDFYVYGFKSRGDYQKKSARYLVKIKYAHDDEPEMVIRILSFGSMIEVLEPESFKKAIIEKPKKQLSCGFK